MATTQKAIDMCRDLQEEIKFLLPTLLTSDVLFHSDGHPYFTVYQSDPAATAEANAVVKVSQIPFVGVDGIGATAPLYANHVIQVAVEANAAGGAGADCLTTQQLLSVLGPCLRKGSQVEVYVRAEGDPPVIATITGRPAAIYKHPVWGLQNNS
jgi:hypothetical protein